MIISVLAATLATATVPVSPAPQSGTVQLAQARDVEIILDERGRRYVVDRWSGEVIAVLPPKRGQRDSFENGREPPRLLRERLRERDQAYGYYDDEEPPADVVAPKVKKWTVEKSAAKPASKTVPGIVTATTPKTSKPTAPVDTPFPSGSSDTIAKVQVVLDRAGISPGVIDGRAGGNLTKALDAYERKTGLRLDISDKAMIEKALAAGGGEAFTSYSISPQDVAGPYVASVPADYSEKARLDRLAYTSTVEMLAERFHMSESYLRELNPGVSFTRPGVHVKVASVGAKSAGTVARIVADKGTKQVRAYDSAGRLIAAYPATIGSNDTPSPSGTVAVDRVAFDPEYTYNPKLNFKQGANDKILTIPPGPNGPVGTIWIALSKPTYGIHGTPEPAQIGKTESHGCVRLTNWDADELARMVHPGTVVQFVD
jgi:lipoprotein-anchoring transpeptidase ErfK/SrfK